MSAKVMVFHIIKPSMKLPLKLALGRTYGRYAEEEDVPVLRAHDYSWIHKARASIVMCQTENKKDV